MAAAVITATTVQKELISSTIISGSAERRLVRLYLEGPKATQSDWFLLSTYLGATDAANVLSYNAVTMNSSNACVAEATTGLTYDQDDYKLVLGSATVGTTFAEVIYYTE